MKLRLPTLAELAVVIATIVLLTLILLPAPQIGTTHGYNEDARKALRELSFALFEKNPDYTEIHDGVVSSCWLDDLYPGEQTDSLMSVEELISDSTVTLSRLPFGKTPFLPVALPTVAEAGDFFGDGQNPEEFILALVPCGAMTFSSRNDLLLLETPVDLPQSQTEIWEKIINAYRTLGWSDVYLCRRNGVCERITLEELEATAQGRQPR